MTSPIGPLRSLMLGTQAIPHLLDRPHFTTASPSAAAELENVTRHLTETIDFAVRSKNNDEVIAHIDGIPEQYQDFAYEGAATGLTVVDTITPFSRRSAEMFTGPAGFRDLTMYVGVGLAYGKIPKPAWRRTFPKHPVLRWLAVDGYGFFKAFFHTEKYVAGKHVERSFPGWMGDPAPVRRAADQGAGRALWFISGGSVTDLARRISDFEPSRQPDLWNGVGIATTFAGGVGVSDLEAIQELVPQYRSQLAGGAAMVAKIRVQTGSHAAHTEPAVRSYCGCSVEEAAAVVDKALAETPTDGAAANYQLWRDRIGELVFTQGD